jgi:hypothetical protein
MMYNTLFRHGDIVSLLLPMEAAEFLPSDLKEQVVCDVSSVTRV